MSATAPAPRQRSQRRLDRREADAGITSQVTHEVHIERVHQQLCGDVGVERENQLEIEAPVQASRLAADRLRLETKISVDRAAAGLPWSKLGMVRGPAHLGASITLVQI
jgi:hypothetical protein